MDELRVTKSDLAWAAQEGHISHKQSQTLWAALVARAGGVSAPPPTRQHAPAFELSHLLYYGGAGVMLFALTVGLFQFLGNIGGAGVATITALYGVGFAAAAAYLWKRPELKTVGGVFATLAVVMVPLTVLGIEQASGMLDGWNHVSSFRQHLPLELSTIVASLIALRYVRFGLLTAPLALASYMLMLDLAWVTVGNEASVNLETQLTMVFGVVLMLGGLFADLRNKTEYDFGFWGYFIGGTAFWLGLNWLTWWGNDSSQLAYLGGNVALMLASVLVSRRLLTAYGALGTTAYMFHLTYTVFKDSQAFPFALAAVGLGMIVVGIAYTKNRAAIESTVNGFVPSSLRKWLPNKR